MPEGGVRFEVRKGGQKFPAIQLDRNLYYLFGRGQGIVDFVVEHPSASRVHFALIHDGANKATYVYDLGSKAKTRIDGKAVPPRAAVLLPDGAMLTVGESARCYILRRKSLWEAEDWRQHFAWERASAGLFSPAVDSFHSIVAFSRVTFHWSIHGFSDAKKKKKTW